MTLERILQAAVNSLSQGKRNPHCFSAHVPGHGHTNDSSDPALRAEYVRQAVQAAQSEADNLAYASEYAEPGYDNPARGIVFADWNCLPRNLGRILERAGYAIEWSDEWTTCADCGRAVRTSPDSYGWQMYARLLNDCEFVCLDCLDWPDYLRSIEDDSTKAVPSRCNPADYGYVRLSEPKVYETGLYPGQTDDPEAVLTTLHASGRTRIVFRIADVGQFDVHWEAWQRIEKEE